MNVSLPTTREDWEYTARVSGGVVRRPLYALLTLLVGFFALTLFVLPGTSRSSGTSSS